MNFQGSSVNGSLEVVGGGRIGWLGASRPLATLSVGVDSIRLRIWFLDKLTLRPEQVVAITTYSFLPMLGLFSKGIRIVHCVMDYPELIVFYGGGDLLARICEAGFIPQAKASSILVRRGMAFRWLPVLLFLVAYNGLALLALVHGMRDFVHGRTFFPLSGPFASAAMLLLLATSVATLRWPAFQQMMLKPGRKVGEIRGVLRFTILISLLLSVGFTVMFLLNHFAGPTMRPARHKPPADQVAQP